MILSQPKRYLDDHWASNTGLYRLVRLGSTAMTRLKIVAGRSGQLAKTWPTFPNLVSLPQLPLADWFQPHARNGHRFRGYSCRKEKSTLTYFVRFTCCPPLAAILNCKAGTLRESLRTRARVSQARVKRRCAALNLFSQYKPRVSVIDWSIR